MTNVESAADFDAILKADNAVLFIYAEWSGPALERSEVVETWERESFAQHAPPDTRIFRVHPWGFPYAANWLYEQPALQFRNADGNLTCLSAPGTLVWLRAGAIVDVAKGFDTDLKELDRRTEIAFKQ